MNKRILKCSLSTTAGIGSLYAYKFINAKYGIGIPCPIRAVTGFYCPGCGITRCVFALLGGDIKRAFRYNQFVFCLLPFLLFYIVYHLYIYILNKKDNIFNRIPNVFYIVLLVIAIGFGIIRNIPYFSFLRPY